MRPLLIMRRRLKNMTTPKNPSYTIAVLISGQGSNLQAMIDAIRLHQWPIKIAVVLSDRKDALGLERAKQAGITAIVLDPQDYVSRDLYDKALRIMLDRYAPDLIVL